MTRFKFQMKWVWKNKSRQRQTKLRYRTILSFCELPLWLFPINQKYLDVVVSFSQKMIRLLLRRHVNETKQYLLFGFCHLWLKHIDEVRLVQSFRTMHVDSTLLFTV